MGLGLAIVQRIVSEHRGTISYSTAHPAGAVFTIDLPVPEPASLLAGRAEEQPEE